MKTSNLFPKIKCFVIIMVDGYEQTLDRKLEFASDEFPRKLNSSFLKVITERKITQHFKESMMTCGISYIIEIIMFSACSHAFL